MIYQDYDRDSLVILIQIKLCMIPDIGLVASDGFGALPGCIVERNQWQCLAKDIVIASMDERAQLGFGDRW